MSLRDLTRQLRGALAQFHSHLLKQLQTREICLFSISELYVQYPDYHMVHQEACLLKYASGQFPIFSLRSQAL